MLKWPLRIFFFHVGWNQCPHRRLYKMSKDFQWPSHKKITLAQGRAEIQKYSSVQFTELFTTRDWLCLLLLFLCPISFRKIFIKNELENNMEPSPPRCLDGQRRCQKAQWTEATEWGLVMRHYLLVNHLPLILESYKPSSLLSVF